MKPIEMRIEGFTSFQREERIDFSGLEVFSITGDNGAGKSSILEAMLFALYGRTHRLGERNKRDLVSLGSDKAAVMLEFSAEGKRYRVTRSFKQKGSPFVKLETFREEKWTTIAEQTQVNHEIEKILRLPYDAFTKAVMVPQGQFDELLKPREPKERRKIMIRLFDLEVYDRMKNRANEILKETQTEEEFVRAQLGTQFVEATPEKLKEMKAAKKELEKQHKTLAADRAERKEKLERARLVVQLLDQSDQVQSQMTRIKNEADKFSSEIKKAEVALAHCKGKEAKEIPNLDKTRQDLSQAEERLKTLVEKEDALQKVDSEMKRIEETLKSLEHKSVELVKARGSAEKSLQETRKQMTDLKYQEELYAQLQASYEEAIDLARLKKDLSVVTSTLGKEADRVDELKKSLDKIASLHSAAEEKAKGAELAAENARRKEDIVRLKLQLKIGEDCPLCENEIHEAPAVSAKDRDAVHKLVEKAELALAGLRKESQDLLESHHRTRGEAASREEAVEKMDRGRKELQTDWDRRNKKLAKSFTLKEDVDAGAYVKEQYETQKEIASAHRKLEMRLKGEEKSFHETERALQDQGSQVRLKEVERDQKQKDRDSIQKEIDRLRGSVEQFIKGGRLPAEQLAAIRSKQKEVAAGIAALRESVADAERKWVRLQSDQENANKTLEDVKKKWKSLKPEVDRIRDEEKSYSDLYVARLDNETENLHKALATMERELGERTKEIEQMERKRKEAQELQARLSELKAKGEVYALLSKHLASNYLQEYVVSSLLQQLVGWANAKLKDLTQGRYQLDLESDSFVVHDAWASNETRIVETLSGGESFVVSLALALALSEFVKGGAHLESLFIDEGFGSLHRDKLELVYGALEALRGTGRMVGLVTHIEELAQRFPSRLHVKNTPSGSTVEKIVVETEF